MGGGRESQEGGAICILTANRYCCTAETNTILSPWDFLGKNTGVGSHFFLQGIFPTQGWNPGLLHCKQTLYHLSHQGSYKTSILQLKIKLKKILKILGYSQFTMLVSDIQ